MGFFRNISLAVLFLELVWSAAAVEITVTMIQPKLLLPLITDEEAVEATGNQPRTENQMITAPHLFEGDILGIPLDIPMQNANNQDVNFGGNDGHKWPHGIIPYELSKKYRPEDKRTIQEALEDFMVNTSIKFREKRESDTDYIDIAPGYGCSSYIGRLTDKQILSLQVPGCMKRGYIHHVLMHAIGFYHEQARTDRDDYVELNWDNIPKEQYNQFQKYVDKEITSYGLPYDFASILHYGTHDFAANDTEWTIRPRNNQAVTFDGKIMGQRDALSRTDLRKVSLAYPIERVGSCLMAPGWVAYNNVCYFFSFLSDVSEKRTFAGARVFCLEKDADVADKPEKDAVVALYKAQMTTSSSVLKRNESVYVASCKTISPNSWKETEESDCNTLLHFICSKRIEPSETAETTTNASITPIVTKSSITVRSDLGITTVLQSDAAFTTTQSLTANSSTQLVTNSNKTSTIALATAIPIAFIVCVGLIAFFCKRQTTRKGNMRKNSNEENIIPVITIAPSQPARPRMLSFRTSSELGKYINLLEIPSANLEISDTILGKGHYGVIFKGSARGLPLYGGPDNVATVAVKRVRDSNNEELQQQLVEEMRIMFKAGSHLNIVNLLGVLRDQGDKLLVLEYCRYGSLQGYLRSHKQVYYHHVDDNGEILPFDEAESDRSSKQAQKSDNAETSDDQRLSTKDLINFSFQIGRGMKYLNSRCIIHRDLAARNILVCDDQVVKVADFGLAKQTSDYIQLNHQVALPVSWMSPEAITRKTYSQKSDVWSFGVVLWEISSLGEKPYSTTDFNPDDLYGFVNALRKGHHMERPFACPTIVYGIMQQCWKVSPEERPVFGDLEKQLQSLLGRETQQDYLFLDERYLKLNEEMEDLLNNIAD